MNRFQGNIWLGDLAVLSRIHGPDFLKSLRVDEELCGAYGFRHEPVLPDHSGEAGTPKAGEKTAPTPIPEIPDKEAEEDLPPVPNPALWMAESIEVISEEELETRREVPPEHRDARPIPDEDFTWGETPDIPGQPLIPWSKLWPFLKRALSRKSPSQTPDCPKLIREISLGRPLRKIPRRTRERWSSRAIVLVDDRLAMAPFYHDYDYLVSRLRKLRGCTGLNILPTREKGTDEVAAALPSHYSDTTVLALSDLGQLPRSSSQQKFWMQIGHRISRAGATPFALCPCPSWRWNSRLARIWNLHSWDRGNRLALSGKGERPRMVPTQLAREMRQQNLERLKTLLAPAVRIEYGLLRDIRLLDSQLDAGTEYDFIESDEVASSPLGSSLRPEVSREHRARIDALSPDIRYKLVSTMFRHHLYNDHVFGHLERIALHQSLSLHSWQALNQMFQTDTGKTLFDLLKTSRVWYRNFIETLIGKNSESRFRPTHFTGPLARFALSDVERTPLSGDSAKNDLISTLWAAAHSALDDLPDELPAFVDPALIEWIDPPGRTKLKSATILLTPNGLRLSEGLLSARDLPGSDPGIFPVSGLHYCRDSIWMGAERVLVGSQQKGGLPLLPEETSRVRIQTARETLRLARKPRPEWAEEWGHDPFGIFAVFRIPGSPEKIRFRWIPPGRFLMGSSKDEKGRRDAEGPQHEAVVSSGFWMADTPATQGQWIAGSRNGKNPSHFQEENSTNRPVESVSWDDVQGWLGHVKDAIPGLFLRLPSEKEWEYACRAGTQGAFNDGSDITNEIGKDPALERLGWYDGNSGDQTRCVAQLPPNAWGLHDMHGNVWEWCEDVWRSSYSDYAKTETARRVVRGGCWASFPGWCRSAYRFRRHAGDRDWIQGFRLCSGQPPEAEIKSASENQEVRAKRMC